MDKLSFLTEHKKIKYKAFLQLAKQRSEMKYELFIKNDQLNFITFQRFLFYLFIKHKCTIRIIRIAKKLTDWWLMRWVIIISNCRVSIHRNTIHSQSQFRKMHNYVFFSESNLFMCLVASIFVLFIYISLYTTLMFVHLTMLCRNLISIISTRIWSILFIVVGRAIEENRFKFLLAFSEYNYLIQCNIILLFLIKTKRSAATKKKLITLNIFFFLLYVLFADIIILFCFCFCFGS